MISHKLPHNFKLLQFVADSLSSPSQVPLSFRVASFSCLRPVGSSFSRHLPVSRLTGLWPVGRLSGSKSCQSLRSSVFLHVGSVRPGQCWSRLLSVLLVAHGPPVACSQMAHSHRYCVHQWLTAWNSQSRQSSVTAQQWPGTCPLCILHGGIQVWLGRVVVRFSVWICGKVKPVCIAICTNMALNGIKFN